MKTDEKRCQYEASVQDKIKNPCEAILSQVNPSDLLHVQLIGGWCK